MYSANLRDYVMISMTRYSDEVYGWWPRSVVIIGRSGWSGTLDPICDIQPLASLAPYHDLDDFVMDQYDRTTGCDGVFWV